MKTRMIFLLLGLALLGACQMTEQRTMGQDRDLTITAQTRESKAVDLADARTAKSQGVGSVTYSGLLGRLAWLGDKVSGEDKAKAFRIAQISAIERYFAAHGEAETENFDAVRSQIEARIEDFALATSILEEQDRDGRYTVVVSVELNVPRLLTLMRKNSPTARANAAGQANRMLTYVFVGRKAVSARSYDARVVRRAEETRDFAADAEASDEGSESERIRGGRVDTAASRKGSAQATARASVTRETGGSRTRKADETAYSLYPMSNIETSITSAFSQGGFEVVAPEEVLQDSDFRAVKTDFSSGEDLAPATLRAVTASLRKNEVPLLILATLDVGAPLQDEATGLPRVSVRVTTRIRDVSGRFSREVASVPVAQYVGTGPDNESAVVNGLKKAALATTREVIARINAAGVH